MCKVCVFFFQGLIACVCFLWQWGACVHSKPSHFFFSLGMAPLLSAPQCPDPVTVPLSVLFFSLKLSSAVHGIRLRLPLLFLCLFRIHYPDFFFPPCLFSRIHKPQQFQIPWLCTFSKPHLKTSWSHTAHLWNHAREVKGKRKHEENGRFTRILFFPSTLTLTTSTVGHNCSLVHDLSVPTAGSQSDEPAAGGSSQNDSVGWEPDLKRR